MTTSPTQFFSEISAGHDGPPIPEARRAYFRARLRNRVFNFILGKFLAEQERGLTQAKLARRIERKPDVVNRWLGMPSNLTLDTVSDLLIGISGEELTLSSESPQQPAQRNYYPEDEWLVQRVIQQAPIQPPAPAHGELGIKNKPRLPQELLGSPFNK
jgi:hypothetical protein